MGKRILLADDSRTIQQAFAMVMDGSGYALSFAKSVDEALAMAKRDGKPDLVLSDVALGSGSGYDLCAGLKADSAMREVPVYLLASSHNPYDDARGRKVGADGHLAKPFESQALLDAVASVLAAPSRVLGVMPEFSADYDDNTARISAKDLPVDDDDSYGEITIERGTPPAPAPAQPARVVKPPSRAAGVRPIPAAGVAPAPFAPPSPRPSLIPGARPSAAMPVARTGMTPQPAPSVPAPGAGRIPLNRTMMGFPSVKPPVVNKPAASATPVAPAAPIPARATPPAPASVSSRPLVISTPPAPAAPMANRPVLPLPSSASPAVASSLRPPVPRLSPPPPTIPIPVEPPADDAPVTRKVSTPLPPDASAGGAVPSQSGPAPSSGLAAAVSAAVDHKVAALAARGPEYEAIAKLSREIIEQVVWEVVPELAETIIRQEIDRLASAKK